MKKKKFIEAVIKAAREEQAILPYARGKMRKARVARRNGEITRLKSA